MKEEKSSIIQEKIQKASQSLFDSEGVLKSASAFVGDKYEPQGVVKINNEMKHSMLILEAKKQKHFENKLFTVCGVTPGAAYIILWQNGDVPDHAMIDHRDVDHYAPVKSLDGILVPIHMNHLEEQMYVYRAKMNRLHNKEIGEIIASKRFEGDDLYKALTSKYK